MIKCQKCGANTQANEGTFRVVTQVREKTYYGGKNGQEIVGQGTEIVKELTVGRCCATTESLETRKAYA